MEISIGKIVKRAFLITFTLYSFVYLYSTFMKWEFTNPFQWIIDIPTIGSNNRGALLSCIICYYVILFLVLIVREADKKKEKENNNV